MPKEHSEFSHCEIEKRIAFILVLNQNTIHKNSIRGAHWLPFLRRDAPALSFKLLSMFMNTGLSKKRIAPLFYFIERKESYAKRKSNRRKVGKAMESTILHSYGVCWPTLVWRGSALARAMRPEHLHRLARVEGGEDGITHGEFTGFKIVSIS